MRIGQFFGQLLVLPQKTGLAGSNIFCSSNFFCQQSLPPFPPKSPTHFISTHLNQTKVGLRELAGGVVFLGWKVGVTLVFHIVECGPLAVISGVISPINRVIGSVTHLIFGH